MTHDWNGSYSSAENLFGATGIPWQDAAFPGVAQPSSPQTGPLLPSSPSDPRIGLLRLNSQVPMDIGRASRSVIPQQYYQQQPQPQQHQQLQQQHQQQLHQQQVAQQQVSQESESSSTKTTSSAIDLHQPSLPAKPSVHDIPLTRVEQEAKDKFTADVIAQGAQRYFDAETALELESMRHDTVCEGPKLAMKANKLFMTLFLRDNAWFAHRLEGQQQETKQRDILVVRPVKGKRTRKCDLKVIGEALLELSCPRCAKHQSEVVADAESKVAHGHKTIEDYPKENYPELYDREYAYILPTQKDALNTAVNILARIKQQQEEGAKFIVKIERVGDEADGTRKRKRLKDDEIELTMPSDRV